jgi:hypothetical protein
MGLFDSWFGPPSRHRFARLLTNAIRKAGDESPFRYDADQFRLIGEGEPVRQVNLEHVYHEYRVAPRNKRAELLRRFARAVCNTVKTIPDDFADVGPDLLAVVRRRSVFSLQKLELDASDEGKLNWPYHVLGDHLGVGLAFDFPESIQMFMQDQLDRWGVTFDEAFDKARSNLAEISDQRFEKIAPGVWASPWHDNYDAARLLLPDLLRDHPVKGELVAAVPNRDTLLLTGSADLEGLARLASMTQEALEAPRPISSLAFQLEGDEWRPFLPPEQHPLFRVYKELATHAFGSDYDSQKPLLERWLEKSEEEVFVATFLGMQSKETGLVRSYCTWSEGVDSLLPRTDGVLFCRMTGEGKPSMAASAPWERVCDVVGDLLVPVADLYPKRFRAREFPSEAQLAALGNTWL